MSDYLGIYQGSVVDNNDVLGIGRVTCLVPQVLADQPTTWCNPIYPTVYKPNSGDIVWVQFVNGDLTKPIYFSSEAVTAEKIEAGTITFDNLSGSAVSEIVTQSLAAARVTIGDQTNRVGDPYFTGIAPFILQAGAGDYLTSSDAGVPAGSPKPTLLKVTHNLAANLEVQNNESAEPHSFTVTGGDVFRAFISAACTDTTSTLGLGVMVYDKNMANPTWVNGLLMVNGDATTATETAAATANTWANYAFEIPIPQTIATGALPYYAVPGWFVGGTNWYITNWQVLKANAGSLIVDGSITTNMLAAKSVTTDKLLIGSGLNAIANPGAETGSVDPHRVVASGVSLTTTTNPVRSGTYGFRLGNLPTRALNSFGYVVSLNGPTLNPPSAMPVKPGDRVDWAGWARVGFSTSSTQCALYVDWMDANGTRISNTNGGATKNLTTSFQQMLGSATAPAGASFAQLNIAVANSTLSDVVEVDDLSMAVAISGASIQMYNSAGVETVDIDAQTGNVTIQGEFGTSPPGVAGVHISSTEFNGIYGLSTYPTVQFNAGNGMDRQAEIFTDTTGNPNLYMASGGSSASYRQGWLKLDNGRTRMGIEKSPGDNEVTGGRIDIANAGITIAADGAVQVTNTAQTAYQDFNAGDINANGVLSSTGNASIGGDCNITGVMQCDGSLQTSASAFQMTTASGSTWKDLNAGNLNSNGSIMATNNLGFQGPTTGSFTANVNWNSASGNFRINTSSRRYKEDIADANIDTEKVLALRPRSFTRNDEEDDEGNPISTGHRYVGFIAEEAADLGLEQFVVRDTEGEPWSFTYDYWSVAQQAVLQAQAKQIADLTARIKELEDRG